LETGFQITYAMCKIWRKNIEKSWVGPCLKLFGKGDAAHYFLRSCSCLCSPSCTDEEWNTLQSIPNHYLWLVDRSYDRAI